ncbi:MULTISPECIES: hypothetical protein [unclassified Ruegeria]|uniref:hypothetical protein n=1 Tax=unclassified Ruegeria TaxID=2625375 RepID=UPI00148866D8|nr:MULTISPECIES: hypothetical protein [unclassified Ruegeria]
MKQTWLMPFAAEWQETKPSLYFSEETRLPMALAFAVNVIGRWVHKGEVYIPFLDAPVMETYKHIKPVYQYVGYAERDAELVGYFTADISVEDWRRLFSASPQAAKQIRYMLGINLQLGYAMPKAARSFAAELANGLEDPKRERKKKTLTHRDTLLSGVAKKVSAAFGMHLGATKSRLQQEPPPECGAVVAAAAMFGHGLIVNYVNADRICRNASLPVETISENYALRTYDLIESPIRLNALAPTPPDEYRADPYKVYGEQFEKAAEHLGIALPTFYTSQ